MEHPGLSYHFLLLIAFHSLFAGFMVFILDTLYTHGNQSDVMKNKVRSHHSPSLNPSVVPRIIKLKSKHLFTPHKTPYDLVPVKTFDLSPTSFGLAHLYAPSSLASCCFLSSCGVFLPPVPLLLLVPLLGMFFQIPSWLHDATSLVAFKSLFKCQLLREPFFD